LVNFTPTPALPPLAMKADSADREANSGKVLTDLAVCMIVIGTSDSFAMLTLTLTLPPAPSRDLPSLKTSRNLAFSCGIIMSSFFIFPSAIFGNFILIVFVTCFPFESIA